MYVLVILGCGYVLHQMQGCLPVVYIKMTHD